VFFRFLPFLVVTITEPAVHFFPSIFFLFSLHFFSTPSDIRRLSIRKSSSWLYGDVFGCVFDSPPFSLYGRSRPVVLMFLSFFFPISFFGGQWFRLWKQWGGFWPGLVTYPLSFFSFPFWFPVLAFCPLDHCPAPQKPLNCFSCIFQFFFFPAKEFLASRYFSVISIFTRSLVQLVLTLFLSCFVFFSFWLAFPLSAPVDIVLLCLSVFRSLGA